MYTLIAVGVPLLAVFLLYRIARVLEDIRDRVSDIAGDIEKIAPQQTPWDDD